MGINGATAHQVFVKAKAQVVFFVGRLKYFARFGHDLRSDAVTGQYQNLFGRHIGRISSCSGLCVVLVVWWCSMRAAQGLDRKSTRLNSSHVAISYAVFCLKKK